MAIATCPICTSPVNGLFKVIIQGENRFELNSCSKCEFAFYPDQNWINQSFSDELNSLDVGVADRTVIAADDLSVMLKSQKLSHGKFLDYGGATDYFRELCVTEDSISKTSIHLLGKFSQRVAKM